MHFTPSRSKQWKKKKNLFTTEWLRSHGNFLCIFSWICVALHFSFLFFTTVVLAPTRRSSRNDYPLNFTKGFQIARPAGQCRVISHRREYSSHYSKSQNFVQKFNFDKTSTFSRVLHPNFFWQFFLWNQSC